MGKNQSQSGLGAGMVGLAPKWVRLAPNWTNPGPNALKSDLRKSRICPIWGQSDPLWSQTYHPCNFPILMTSVKIYLAPQLLFLYRMVKYNPPKYGDGSPFPPGAQGAGWILLTIALCPVPICFGYRLFKAWQNPDIETFQEVNLLEF